MLLNVRTIIDVHTLIGTKPHPSQRVLIDRKHGKIGQPILHADAFEKLVQASYRQGFILNACSAYRSYGYQENLYNNGVANYGQEYADAYWTRPGSSEHQTGLSVDVRMDNDFSDLDAVRNHPQYDWLLGHLADYGFILRYPDDKQEYTLIAPESWHLRYVGQEAAREIADHNWCLEEYLYYQN